MKKTILLMIFTLFTLNIFAFSVVLVNNKKISGDFVKETKTEIVITTNDNLYNIDKDIVLFYLSEKEKIPVGKAREKLTPKKIRYNSIVETIDINKENYKDKTKFFKSYKKDGINQDAVYHIYLNDGRSYAGYYRSATIRFIFFKDIGSEKIYKFKKNVIKMIIENDKDVTQDLLDSYDENEKNYSDEANIIYISSLSPSNLSEKSERSYKRVNRPGFRGLYSFVITSSHKLEYDHEKSDYNAKNGFQINFEWLSKVKQAQNAGYGFGISLIPYRKIVYKELEPKYGFFPIYGLIYFPITKNKSGANITLRVGIDFLFANKDYKAPFDTAPLIYLSPAFYYNVNNMVLGIGFQYNSGRLTYPGLSKDVYVYDTSIYLSLGLSFF